MNPSKYELQIHERKADQLISCDVMDESSDSGHASAGTPSEETQAYSPNGVIVNQANSTAMQMTYTKEEVDQHTIYRNRLSNSISVVLQ